MKKTLLTLVAGAAIGSGTTLTLPDGSTAVAEAPTAAEVYDQKQVASLKLLPTDEGPVARYILQQTSSIKGIAPISEAGEKENQQSVFDAVQSAAKKDCEADPKCSWSPMEAARSTAESLSATLSGGGIVSISQTVPELEALKAEILAEN